MTKAIIVGRDGRIIEGDGIVPDGATLRVPMPLMDSGVSSALRKVFGDSADSKALHDGQGGPAGFRPGYAFGGSVPFAHHQRAGHARAAYLDALRDAWRNPSPLPPRIEPKSSVAQPARAVVASPVDVSGDKDSAWHAYVNNLSNAWRNP